MYVNGVYVLFMIVYVLYVYCIWFGVYYELVNMKV